MRGPRARGEDADWLVADLPPVAVRAVQHVAPPALPDPRHLVDQPRGDEQPPGAERAAVIENHDESVLGALGRGDAPVGHSCAVAADLLPARFQQRGRVHVVPGEKAVDPGSGRVARLARVDH